MSSDLTVRQGIYDPSRRFAFTNITDEPFTFKWADNPITVKPHDTIELPHHLAVKATIELTDRVMIADMDRKTREAKEKNPLYLAPNQAGSLGVPAARKPYEEKILRELKADEDDPQVQIRKAQMREELMRDLNTEKSTGSPTLPVSSVKEFDGVNLPNK